MIVKPPGNFSNVTNSPSCILTNGLPRTALARAAAGARTVRLIIIKQCRNVARRAVTLQNQLVTGISIQ